MLITHSTLMMLGKYVIKLESVNTWTRKLQVSSSITDCMLIICTGKKISDQHGHFQHIGIFWYTVIFTNKQEAARLSGQVGLYRVIWYIYSLHHPSPTCQPTTYDCIWLGYITHSVGCYFHLRQSVDMVSHRQVFPYLCMLFILEVLCTAW